ncbi:exported hypothetical protein [Candidatus Magnetomoraceae bacterium gMMP-15]
MSVINFLSVRLYMFIFISTLCALTQTVYAATVWQESFETDGNGSRYNFIQGQEFSDGSSDFFIRTELILSS